MEDREFDELVDQMKNSHHNPPPAPADRMWGRIEAARAAGAGRPARRQAWPWWQVGLAAAAVLVVGIAIGRFAVRPDAGPQLAAGVDPAAAPVPGHEAPVTDAPPRRPPVEPLVRFAAVSLFNRADVLLTDLQTTDCARTDPDPLPAWAGNMLAQTRLLLDTGLADDPGTRTLLQDLELVLARISSMSPADCAADMDRIRQDLKDKSTVDRLRLAGAGRVDPRSL